MNIKISTRVNQNYKSVFAGFTEELFLKLAPPFPPFKLLRFDGCKTNDEVHIRLWNFGWTDWIALITDDFEHSNQIGFVDEGKVLPSFLKSWKHQHIIQDLDQGSEIIDNIQYTCPNRLLEYLIYPFLYLQFIYRKPVYRNVFK